jgi:macrocin-O-methyltransferase TylF-like protien
LQVVSDSDLGELAGPQWRGRQRILPLIAALHRLLDFPFAVIYLLSDRGIHPAYRMGWLRRIRLALRMYRNTRRIPSLTSYKAHLAMAVKLLEIPPEVEGVVVECGCYLGGSTANLSLACEIVGRDLIVYDSFEGLPSPDPRDKYGNPFTEGLLDADLEQVKANVRRWGAIGRCTFVKGFFADTLPQHEQPTVLCFLDVDLQGSLHDCVVNLWPHLTERGYVFIDEYVFPDYCALFYSERYWRENFDTTPPGLLGAGSGVGLGAYYLGPWSEHDEAPLQTPASVAYTRKDFSGYWEFYPDEGPTGEPPAEEL